MEINCATAVECKKDAVLFKSAFDRGRQQVLDTFLASNDSKSRWLRFGEWKWSRDRPLNGEAHGMFIYEHFRIALRANHVGASVMRILLARWEANLLA